VDSLCKVHYCSILINYATVIFYRLSQQTTDTCYCNVHFQLTQRAQLLHLSVINICWGQAMLNELCHFLIFKIFRIKCKNFSSTWQNHSRHLANYRLVGIYGRISHIPNANLTSMVYFLPSRMKTCIHFRHTIKVSFH